VTLLATFWTIAAEHVISFAGGVLVGFALSNRYRVIKRNGDG